MGTIITTNSSLIHLGSDCFDHLNQLLSDEYDSSKKLILTDSNTKLHCLPLLTKILSSRYQFEVINILPGEENKNLKSCEYIWTELSRMKADKKSVILNLGGGMICDLGAFAASTFLRGIDFVQIPTSLLAMVDASSGGKTGINFSGLKNQVGNFSNPRSVYIYPNFIETLPERDFNSGLAEIIKHAIIADPVLWKFILEKQDSLNVKLDKLIKNSLEVKNKFVELDPYDKKERHALNFGHTIGHALESYSLSFGNAPLRHGEAVAFGMIAESILSNRVCGLPDDQMNEINGIISKQFSYLHLDFEPQELMRFMHSDKKNEDHKINFSLLSSIGNIRINQHTSESNIIAAIDNALGHFMKSVA